MPSGDLDNKAAQRVEHVGQRLTMLRLREEDDEIHGMALVHRQTNFRVALEAADSRSITCTRIDDDNRRFCRIDAIHPALVTDFDDSEQGIVRGALKLTRVEDHLKFEIK